MSDHRRLDALFAERVLGCKVIQYGGDPCCGCTIDHPHGDWDNCCEMHHRRLSPYTRSLDAVWEGLYDASGRAESFNRFGAVFSEGWRVIESTGKPHRDCNAIIGHTDTGLNWSAHPAEALVIACLRAVGVSEEEIDGR